MRMRPPGSLPAAVLPPMDESGPGRRLVKEEQKKSSCAATAERWINCEEDGINPQRQTDTCSHSTAPAAAAAHGCRCSHEESEPASARAPDGVLCGDGKPWTGRLAEAGRREEKSAAQSEVPRAARRRRMNDPSTLVRMIMGESGYPSCKREVK